MPWPTDPAEQFFGRGGWGWDGTQWRKQSLLVGYTDRYREFVSSSVHAAGSIVIAATAVPAGYIYTIEAVYTLQATTGGSHQWIRAFDGAVGVYFVFNSGITAGIPYPTFLSITLKEGDYVQASFGNTILNEAVYLGVWGRKTKVT